MKCSRSTRTALTGILLALGGSLWPTSTLADTPDQDLLPLLYETLGGDNWHNNDGWLDPEVDWCDWYGVDCFETEFRRLELPDNNLAGTLTPELAELLFVNQAPKYEIDLSGNAIGGELPYFPWRTETVDLTGNAMTGALPGFTDEERPSDYVLERLRLARNDFEGAVPANWERLFLRWLDLADNRLDAGHEHAFAAMHTAWQSFLRLNGNRFSGVLTAEITAYALAERGDSNTGAGLDICFNDLTVNDPAVRDWIAARHVGSPDFEQCLGRERTTVDATLSGSWYHPERSGEGVSLMMLDNGAPLLYSFSFDSEGRQQWLFEVGETGEHWLRWDPLRETRGHFGEGIARDEDYTFIRSTARFRFDRVGEDTLSLHRHYYDLVACGPWGPQSPPSSPMPCGPPLFDDRLDYQRLSNLAGTTCDNQRPQTQEFSGAWYNPERAGEGFIVEVLSDGKAVVYWFTHKPDGSGEQAWMIGVGEARWVMPLPPNTTNVSLTFDEVYQPVGGQFGPAFDPAELEMVDWGELSMHFRAPNSGEIQWDSHLEEYGAGSYAIERLARPMLAECEE